MTKSKLLLTGFDRFPGVDVNASKSLIDFINKTDRYSDIAEVYTHVFKTEYDATLKSIGEILSRVTPDIIISFGVAPNLSNIRLERYATNVISQTCLDDTGEVFTKPHCEGVDKLKSTLPLKNIQARLTANKLAFEISDSAGEYLCNFLSYQWLTHDYATMPPQACGFIHIPQNVFYLEMDATLQLNSIHSSRLLRAIDIIIKTSLDTILDINDALIV